MNKTHWVKIVLESDVPDKEIETLVKQAYDLIVQSLPKSTKTQLGLS